MNKRDFDKEAATWDSNATRVKLAADVSAALLQAVSLRSDMDALDFGCGTGLLAVTLAAHTRSVAALDSSDGMLNVLRSKAADHGIKNLRVENSSRFNWNANREKYDLCLCSMTLHHIEDLDTLFAQFLSILKPGGLLCLADLDPDGGKFHEDNTGVFHFGFEREELKRKLGLLGLKTIHCNHAANVTRQTKDGRDRDFSVFLIVAQKT